METIIANSLEQLCNKCSPNIYIYGAKTIAQRVFLYLKSQGNEVKSFLVSEKYDNPTSLFDKKVARIEENPEQFYECIILAVSGNYIWETESFLRNYNIDKLIIINPAIDDAFPSDISFFLSEQSTISSRTFISDGVYIYADDTSSIIIEDEVSIENGSIILVTENSTLHIGKGSRIEEKSQIIISDNSSIKVSEKCVFGEKSSIFLSNNSSISIGSKSEFGEFLHIYCQNNCEIIAGAHTNIGRDCDISVENHSTIAFEHNNNIGQHGIIYNQANGKITFKRNATVNVLLYLSVKNSEVSIGEDAMLSLNLKIVVGTHKLIDTSTHTEITNHSPIIIGDHVWIGMGATLLPGAHIHEGSVVGAQALVNKEIPAHCVCAGIPAKVIRENVEWER